MAEETSLATQVQDIEPRVLSAVEMRQQVQAIQQVMEAVMKSGTHYGTVPGCGDKPTLLKAGAEKIMLTFRLGGEPYIDDLSTPDCIRYRVRMRIFSILNGNTVGYGIGEASTGESKYRWRSAISDEEFETTDLTKRRIKFFKTGKTKQIMTEDADQANTVLKMAKKRALVDGILTATAASDIFTQDLEDIPAENLNPRPSGGKPEVRQPTAKAPAGQATPAQGQAQGAEAFDPFKTKLTKETVAQILEMTTEMKWAPAKVKAKFEMYEGIGDKAALDACQAEYRTYINGLK